jgi:hypothetical protein
MRSAKAVCSLGWEVTKASFKVDARVFLRVAKTDEVSSANKVDVHGSSTILASSEKTAAPTQIQMNSSASAATSYANI